MRAQSYHPYAASGSPQSRCTLIQTKNGKFSIEACRFALNLPLSATPPKITATEADYSGAKALRALALWGEWIGARGLAHSKHIHSPHTTTAGCEALVYRHNTQRSAYKSISTLNQNKNLGGRTMHIRKYASSPYKIV